jgi:hypothetical protein
VINNTSLLGAERRLSRWSTRKTVPPFEKAIYVHLDSLLVRRRPLITSILGLVPLYLGTFHLTSFHGGKWRYIYSWVWQRCVWTESGSWCPSETSFLALQMTFTLKTTPHVNQTSHRCMFLPMVIQFNQRMCIALFTPWLGEARQNDFLECFRLCRNPMKYRLQVRIHDCFGRAACRICSALNHLHDELKSSPWCFVEL